MKYLYNRGYSCSAAQCDKIKYHTHTCATCFTSTAGIPIPVLNPTQAAAATIAKLADFWESQSKNLY
jgi:hypothetical protein